MPLFLILISSLIQKSVFVFHLWIKNLTVIYKNERKLEIFKMKTNNNNNNMQIVSRNDEPLLKKKLVCCFCETYSQRECYWIKKVQSLQFWHFFHSKNKMQMFSKISTRFNFFIFLLFNFVVFDIRSCFFFTYLE